MRSIIVLDNASRQERTALTLRVGQIHLGQHGLHRAARALLRHPALRRRLVERPVVAVHTADVEVLPHVGHVACAVTTIFA